MIDFNKTARLHIWMVLSGFSFSILSLCAQGYDLTDRLVLHLPMNGNATDQSGNNVPTTVYGAVLTEDRHGNPESAYLFNGQDSRINLNNDQPVITEITWSIVSWVKVNGPSNSMNRNNLIFQQRDDDPEAATALSTITFEANKDDSTFASIRSSLTIIGEPFTVKCPAFEYGEWHHYAATLDEDNYLNIYLDGEFCNRGLFPENGDFKTSIHHVDLGVHIYRENVIRGALNGVLDDVYIYNRALDICEIKVLYNGSLPEER